MPTITFTPTPLILVLAVLLGYVVPLASAWLTSHPSAWTGFATVVLSAAAGFLGEWIEAGTTFDWRKGLSTAIGALVMALIGNKVSWSGTDVSKKLYAAGAGGEDWVAADEPPPARYSQAEAQNRAAEENGG